MTKDTTTAGVSESPTSVVYGDESASLFTATVTTGNHEVLPASESGTVDVGSASCPVTLAPGGNGGSGTCQIANSALAVGGPYAVTFTYGGDADLSASTQATATTGLSVTKDTTTAGVSESPTSVVYGDESASLFTATVTTGNHEVLPASESGTVNVGSASCPVTLAPGGNGGSGTCQIANSALAVGGPYAVTFTYGGDADLSASTQATATTGLSVTKDTTTAGVSESPTSVVYGDESASLFTATVTTGNHEVLPASESGTVNVGTASCPVTLAPGGNGGSGTCQIANSALAVGGPYAVTFTYGGDADLSASTQATAPTGLSVTKDTTTAGVSESPTSVVYGDESASLFTATVTTGNHEVLPASESGTVDVGSASCPVTLAPGGNGGSGTCQIANSALGRRRSLRGDLHLRRRRRPERLHAGHGDHRAQRDQGHHHGRRLGVPDQRRLRRRVGLPLHGHGDHGQPRGAPGF